MDIQKAIQKAKETMLEYVRQFETDAAMGLKPDRTRRELLRRISPYQIGKEAYSELVREREIHEVGTGYGNAPITVAIGPAETKPVVPQPWNNIELLDLIAFVVRIHDYYETKNWPLAALDIRAELKKALSEYQPGRPY